MALQSSLDPDALPQLIGDFLPVDEWQAHINEVFYGLRGSRVREFYQTFASADSRLAYALAEDYFGRLSHRAKNRSTTEGPVESTLVVMEWGCGNGNLAACFLDRLKALDIDSQFYPLVEYHLIDKHEAVLTEAKNNKDLMPHQERTIFTCGSIESLQSVAGGSVDRIICNELWSELPTKLLLRKASDLSEEHLRPNVSEAKLAEIENWEGFVQAFDQKDIDALTQHPSFLEDLVWEREYHAVESKSLSFRRTVSDFLKHIDEEVLVPVNTGAASTMKEAVRLLSPTSLGFSSFDAGTYSQQVLNDPEKPCYSVHGGQFSFMVNFALLEEIAKHLGAKANIESQREYVGTHVGESVLTLMDLLATHPNLPSPESWEFDALVIRTLEALNTSYRSQYKRVIEFPLREAMPAEEKARLAAIIRDFKPEGVPDTIAYITASEMNEAQPALEKLGYEKEGIRGMLQEPPQLVDYTHFFLDVS